MKSSFISFSILIFALTIFRADAQTEKDWMPDKNADGIQIFLREIPGSSIRESRGVMYLTGVRLSSIVAVFDNTDSYTKWVYACSEARLIDKVSAHERYNYIVIKAPWPVSERDMINHSVLVQDRNSLEIQIRIRGVPSYMKEVPGRVRVSSLSGLWIFRPVKPGVVMVVYQMHSEPGGSVPDWLVDSSVVNTPYVTLLRLRKLVGEQKYREARISGILDAD